MIFVLFFACIDDVQSSFSSHSVLVSSTEEDTDDVVARECTDSVQNTWDELTDQAIVRGLQLDIPLWEEYSMCNVIPGGVVAQDLNHDGEIDLLFSNPKGSPWAFRNKGKGQFVEINIEKRLFDKERPALALAAVDLNGDFLPELIQSGAGYLAIAENLGDFRFSPWSLIINDSEFPMACYGSFHLGDYDQDGDLDIVLAGTDQAVSSDFSSDSMSWEVQGSYDLLIEQNNGSWDVVAELSAWPGIPGLSILQVFSDWDNDRDLDLISGSDRADALNVPPMAFWENQINETGQAMLLDVATELHTNLPVSAMGYAANDINQDGFLDYCLTDIRKHLVCFLSDGLGSFYEAGLSMGLQVFPENIPEAPQNWKEDTGDGAINWVAWSLLLEDINNDGFLDAVATAGPTPDYGSVAFSDMDHWQPDWLWIGSENGFESLEKTHDFYHSGGHYGMVSVDLNHDGFREIIKVPAEGNPIILENPCTENNWLEIDLLGDTLNTEGFGAKVFVETSNRIDQQEMLNLLTVGQGPSVLHFGLGEETLVSELRVWWPEGETSVLTDVSANQHLVIRHPNSSE